MSGNENLLQEIKALREFLDDTEILEKNQQLAEKLKQLHESTNDHYLHAMAQSENISRQQARLKKKLDEILDRLRDQP